MYNGPDAQPDQVSAWLKGTDQRSPDSRDNDEGHSPYPATVSKLAVRKALTDRGWKADAAETISNEVPNRGNVAGMKELGAGAAFIPAGYPGQESTQGQVEWGENAHRDPSVVEHEYHHAWDWDKQDANLRSGPQFNSLRRDQGATGAVVRNTLDNPDPSQPDWHLNHRLAEGLDYDYSSIPQWYMDEYFSHANRGPSPETYSRAQDNWLVAEPQFRTPSVTNVSAQAAQDRRMDALTPGDEYTFHVPFSPSQPDDFRDSPGGLRPQ